MKVAGPSQDPLAALVSELQRWAESFWLGPSPQNQRLGLMTGRDMKIVQSSVSVHMS